MELGIITDEVHADFEIACGHISDWGLPIAEVRNVNGKNVTQLTQAEAEAAARVVRAAGLKVSAIASPVFKSPLDEKSVPGNADFSVAGAVTVADQLALLERSCELAKLFGTNMVRVFTFLRVPWSGAVVADVVQHMVSAAAIAQRHDVILAVENEPACIVGSGQELGAFFKELDAALGPELQGHVGALWDPGNALSIGEQRPFPDGYRAIPTKRLVHVHLKDTHTVPATFGTFVPLGQGRLDYVGQFAALRRDGYRGSVVLEPHYAPAGVSTAEAAYKCVLAAQELLAAPEAKA